MKKNPMLGSLPVKRSVGQEEEEYIMEFNLSPGLGFVKAECAHDRPKGDRKPTEEGEDGRADQHEEDVDKPDTEANNEKE